MNYIKLNENKLNLEKSISKNWICLRYSHNEMMLAVAAIKTPAVAVAAADGDDGGIRIFSLLESFIYRYLFD